MKIIAWAYSVFVLMSCTAPKKMSDAPPAISSEPHQFWSADWSPDGRYIAVAGVDSMVRIFHAHNLKLYRSFPVEDWTHVVEWHPFLPLLAIATRYLGIQLIDIESGKVTSLLSTFDTTPTYPASGARGMAWNADGMMLGVGGLDGILRLYDTKGQLLKIMSMYPPGTDYTTYLALDWHPIKNEFVAANFEITVLDTSGIILHRMIHPNKGAILLCAEWHPSGEYFVTGDYGHNWEGENVPSLLHFWSSDGTYIRSVAGSRGEIRNIAWSPDGQRLASASDVLRIWDADGQLLNESLSDDTNTLWGIDWSPDGKRIVSASNHKTVTIWDAQGRKVNSIQVP